MVLRSPRVRYLHIPQPIAGIEQVVSIKLLGVVFQCDFRMNKHVDFILSQCSQRLYLLKLLRNMGLGPGQLNIVAHSIIVSRIRYACLLYTSDAADEEDSVDL